jgi:hypothetical protein
VSTATSQRRLIALVRTGSRLDIAAPIGDTVGQALVAVGIRLEPNRHALVTRTGGEVGLDTRVLDLEDGTLLTIVDLTARPVDGHRRSRASAGSRHDHYSSWWLIGTAGVLLAAGALVALATNTLVLSADHRAVVASLLGAGAVLSAAVWTRRTPGDHLGTAVAMVAPAALAFAAGAFAAPPLALAPQLGVTIGLLAAALLCGTATVTARGRELRGIAATSMGVLLILAAIWGVTLAFGWTAAASAAISLGIVAPGLRFLPTTLLDLPEGYSINYEHFMSSRWTVRGTVPDDPGVVTMDRIRPYVSESSARLAGGTVMLSLIPPLFVPFMLPGLSASSFLVRLGTIGALAATVIVLTLLPRHGSSGPLRWIPRASAGLMTLEVVCVAAAPAGPGGVLIAAGALLVFAIAAAGLVVPMGKGSRSLVWSRLADMIEGLGVTLALPLALLSADVLEGVREMMAR